MTEKVFSKPEVMYFHPCVKDKNKVSADIKLKKVLNMKSVHYLVKNSGFFTDVRYSEELSLVKFEYKEKSIMIFGNGTIEIRGAEDEKDVKDTLVLLDKVSAESEETAQQMDQMKAPKGAYSENIMKHIKNPHNSGEMQNPDSVGTVTSPICGDVMTIQLKVEKGRIVDAKFQTLGCGVSIATSSVITEMAKGKTLEQALEIKNTDVIKELNGVPGMKVHCSNLAADSLHAAVREYMKKHSGG